MSVLAWIVAGGLLMSALALSGAAALLLDTRTQERLVRPLVAFAAGSLLGGALLHMIPEAASATGARSPPTCGPWPASARSWAWSSSSTGTTVTARAPTAGSLSPT